MFEQKGGSTPMPTSTTQKKPATKWSKPAVSPTNAPVTQTSPTQTSPTQAPPTQQSDDEEDDGQTELPPVGMSRNLVAKFSQIESQQPSSSSNGPIRATSQPRQHAAPPSSVEYTEPPRARQSQTPDSGIGEVVTTTADDQLPEQGTTQNLLAQWRNKEQSTDVPKPRQTTRSYSSDRELQQERKSPARQQSEPLYRHEQMDSTDGGPEVVRPDGEASEKVDEMPAPSTTKNLLAKFQNLQAEAQRDVEQAPPKKKVRPIKLHHDYNCQGTSLCMTPRILTREVMHREVPWPGESCTVICIPR